MCSELGVDSEVYSQTSLIGCDHPFLSMCTWLSWLGRWLAGLGGWCHMFGVPGSIPGQVQYGLIQQLALTKDDELIDTRVPTQISKVNFMTFPGQN